MLVWEVVNVGGDRLVEINLTLDGKLYDSRCGERLGNGISIECRIVTYRNLLVDIGIAATEAEQHLICVGEDIL